MTKTEIIQHLASECDCTQKLAGEVLDAFTKLVGEELKGGNTVQIMGFGKFTSSKCAGRTGKNPLTGEDMEIPETMRIYFSSGNLLKQKVNEALTGKKASKKTTTKTAKTAPTAKTSSKKKAKKK